MDRRRLKGLNTLFAFTALAVMLAASGARGSDAHPVYEHAPPPEVLAKQLFGPRYRSAEVTGTERFGMRIRFNLDSARILKESHAMLKSVGDMLHMEHLSHQALVIEGHADTRGSSAYNLALSERRASAIKQYLVRHHGVAAARLVTVGFGEERPYDLENGESAVNRRVEFRAVRNIVIR